MGKWQDKYGNKIRFCIFIAVAVYLAYGIYFAVYGLQFSVQLSQDQYVYGLISKNPLWWQIAYYLSEGVTGSIAIVLRAFAACFAAYAAYLYWRKADSAMPAIRKNASRALLLEAAFFLAIIPSIIAAFAYNSTSEYLFYFDHTPELILLFGTAIPCLAMVLTAAPLLLKLRAKINADAPTPEIVKWASYTALAYVLVVFWFNYCMLWAANMVPYDRANQVFGLEFLLQPVNFVSFATTAFGLLAVGIAAYVTLRPALKGQHEKVNLTHLGAVIAAFAAYFIFNTVYYIATGGYEAHPSVWYEVISPMHNANLWTMALLVVGVPLIWVGRRRKNHVGT
ncbi:MAG: hypothetical protein NWE96_04260 [Candidatus Bathyarchaeota archaeon]|nr:hypothetical protein [Candidatus Bathyarchaeota archaeon]